MFCPKCGNQLNEGAIFCPKCGAKIGEAGNAPQMASPNVSVKKKSGSDKKPLFIVLAVVAVIILLIIVHSLFGNSDAKVAKDAQNALLGTWHGSYDGQIYDNDPYIVHAERTITFYKDGTCDISLSQTDAGIDGAYQQIDDTYGVTENAHASYQVDIESVGGNEYLGHVLISVDDGYDPYKVYFSKRLQFVFHYNSEAGRLTLSSNGGDPYTTHGIDYSRN